jgi:hypothetical protein
MDSDELPETVLLLRCRKCGNVTERKPADVTDFAEWPKCCDEPLAMFGPVEPNSNTPDDNRTVDLPN